MHSLPELRYFDLYVFDTMSETSYIRGLDCMQNLPGKTAFVTGGASGIGLGIAKALSGAGMNVVIADILDEHLEAAKAELGRAARILALKLDVTDRNDFARAADSAE